MQQKKLHIVANLMMSNLLLAQNHVGQKLQILFLCPTKLRKRDRAFMDPVDSSSDETDKEMDEAGKDCNYKPTKK